MRFLCRTLIFLGLLAPVAASAGLYKCKSPNGAVQWSDSPCPNTAPRVGEKWEAMEAERKQREASERQEREIANQAARLTQHPAVGGKEPEDAVGQMTTYAVALGRSMACGADTVSPLKRVGRWMDSVFPPGSPGRRTQLAIFSEGMRFHAEQQKAGNSPDDCSTVLRSFRDFPWP